MCNHAFRYPEDTRENYNPDGMTMTGVCKYCGVKKRAYGNRWAIVMEETFLYQVPSGEAFEWFDNSRIVW